MGILNFSIRTPIHGDLQVLHRFYYWLLLLIFMIFPGDIGGAEQWYLSNATGMVLESSPSRFAALRYIYSLSIGIVSSGELPTYLEKYYSPSYRIELHILYENRKPLKRRWLFRDTRGITRLVSSMRDVSLEETFQAEVSVTGTKSADGTTSEKESPAQASQAPPTGFIEIYNEQNLITEEHHFLLDGTESITTYFYNRAVLIRAETQMKIPASEESEAEQTEPEFVLVLTDSYRYSRSNSLRAVERVYHRAISSDSNGENSINRLQFPHLGLNAVEKHFVSPSTPYSSVFLQDIIPDSDSKSGDRVVYTTDDRGKVLSETRKDEAGETLGEIRNTWTGDRLESIDWKAGEDERRTEYEYNNGGDRILERNYNKDVLERTVRWENNQEIEELYMNGEVILRAIWENGRKISEESVPSTKTN